MFSQDLEVWGPHSSQPTPDLAAARAYCRTLATTHHENFPLVSWLLPNGLHQHFYNVYAYCRWADDLGFESGVSGAERVEYALFRGDFVFDVYSELRSLAAAAKRDLIENDAGPNLRAYAKSINQDLLESL